jgi:hypothetical protein
MKLVAAIFLAMTAVAAAANFDSEVRTVDGAIVCEVPWKLSEALKAVKANDATWFAETGCRRTHAGLKVIRIDPYASMADPLQVRLYAKDGKSFTVWMFATSLETRDGKPIFPF